MGKVTKPNIPNSIRITAKVSYEIVYVDSFKDETILGEMRPDMRQIVLKNGQSNTELTKTFIHECLHAIADENGVVLTESQVGSLEHAVYRFLRLNGYL
jgi:hypothetical protein